ncbi:hypothetical protein [Sphingomonas xinjiangensis]|uniref:Uncharacterized protein YecT (DUF1311 family) n=1 Tax=Sphingomonas xinjiangensis TaxID=643568 RepID=A0A840YP51_9SPHN|nr:hypothetical protein [Sphingomonas xinjiangensis]MBB5711940.1 uncharacterized protein YecT (DUF1311 family) [Sphingomonas xinjiangensis]
MHHPRQTHNTTTVPGAGRAARELRMQDARLSETYQIATARLAATRAANLAGERHWIVA